ICAILIVFDRASASCLSRIQASIFTGDQTGGLVNAAIRERESEVLVFGSSVARHHVDCELLARETGLTCYNVGCDGQNILYARIVEDLLLQQGCQSKYFIFVVNWNDLFFDDVARVKMLNSFRDRSPAAAQILDSGDRWNRIKCLSHLYHYNGLAISILRHRLAPDEEGVRGYVAMENDYVELEAETMQMQHDLQLPLDSETIEMAEGKLALYDGFVRAAKERGIQVVFVVSPTFRDGIEKSKREEFAQRRIQEIAEQRDAVFLQIDESTHDEFADKRMFADRRHLNRTGSQRFTTTLAAELAKLTP
ncbi:MAG: hypothetical protein KDB27_10835, partial [Planctomycetales bacterium]|nr:hypothetical protein [Planctomycetales bacterium]